MSASERILENIASQQRSEQSQCKHSSSKSTHDCPAATIQSELDHVRGMAPNSDAALGNYKREAALYASIEGDMKKGGDAARLQSAYDKARNQVRKEGGARLDQERRRERQGGDNGLGHDRAQVSGNTNHPFYGEFLSGSEKI